MTELYTRSMHGKVNSITFFCIDVLQIKKYIGVMPIGISETLLSDTPCHRKEHGHKSANRHGVRTYFTLRVLFVFN